ncbi:MAG: NADH-quinone oxidoreductase subunit J [Anaerolineales bacterium]|jgi:NADH-quinone oxidoreductase subunit J|nr:NADH-quinone oxidoreductase subunit J [Anaerolineales bacterium]
MMTSDFLLFIVLAVVAVASALSMLLSRNAVYSALFLVINFATIAVFFLLLGSPFLAMAQVTIYAGAIMVLFLFVIMLLGAEPLSQDESLPWQRPVAIILGVVLLVETGIIGYSLGFQEGLLPSFTSFASDYASPGDIGILLFNEYLLPFEITSVLLLVAMIGAIVLTRNQKS